MTCRKEQQQQEQQYQSSPAWGAADNEPTRSRSAKTHWTTASFVLAASKLAHKSAATTSSGSWVKRELNSARRDATVRLESDSKCCCSAVVRKWGGHAVRLLAPWPFLKIRQKSLRRRTPTAVRSTADWHIWISGLLDCRGRSSATTPPGQRNGRNFARQAINSSPYPGRTRAWANGSARHNRSKTCCQRKTTTLI